MRLLFLISLLLPLCSVARAQYLINPQSKDITISTARDPNAPQYDIELKEFSPEIGAEVLKIITSPAKKQIDPKQAFENFKKVGGHEEKVDILLIPITLNLKYDEKLYTTKVDITFSNGGVPTESLVYFKISEETVEVSIG